MDNNWEKWIKRLVLIQTFIAAWILLLIVGVFYSAYRLAKQGSCFVSHEVIFVTLKEHIESGGEIPSNLSELTSSKYIHYKRRLVCSNTVSYEEKYYDLKCYPNAWNKPGKILLRSSVLGSYVVTFGDGSSSLSRLNLWV